MAFQDFINRFNFWNYKREEPRPKSVLDPLSYEDANSLNQYLHQFSQLRNQEPDSAIGLGAGIGGLDYMSWITIAEHNKEERCRLYREMMNNPYVNEAVDEIVFTAINEDHRNSMINLEIKNPQLSANDNITDNLMKQFDYIVDKVLEYKYNFPYWFREFVHMGEVGLEYLIPSDDGRMREQGIVGVNFLGSENYVPKHNPDGSIDTFVVRNNWNADTRILAARDQFAYTDSGMYDFINGLAPSWANHTVQSKDALIQLVKSYIDIAKKPYRQLDALEDAVVIYRLARAPERLVFNVAAGNLPKNKSEQYVKQLMERYRKKLTYNQEDGRVDSTQNVKNFLEDYWFIKDQQGKGTDVTSLGGGEQLGNIQDVEFFVQKLYKALKVPYSRFTGESTFEQGTGMPRDEVKFERFVYMILRRFVDVVKQVYFQHLKITGVWKYYDLDTTDFDIIPTPPSSFTYMKNAEKMEAQFAMFANYANNIDTEEPLFARETALKEGLGWTDEQIKRNEIAKRREKEGKTVDEEDEGEEGDDLDLGGDMDLGGGMDLGGDDLGGEDLGGEDLGDIDL